MLSLPASMKIFVYTGMTDMRRSFDRLAQMVEEHFEQDPESGHLYLFFNRRRDSLKALLWEGDGFVIFYKRLELGTFAPLGGATLASTMPSTTGPSRAGLQISASDLNLLLAGADPARVTRQKRFQRTGV
jgi:transposase